MSVHSIRLHAWVLTTAFVFHMSLAQEAPMPAMDHSKMDHSTMDQSKTESSVKRPDMKQMDDQKQPASAAATSSRGDAEPTLSEKAHVPPDPPQYAMGEVPPHSMQDMMQMDDRHQFGKVIVDQLEWRAGNDAFKWDAQAWYGSDYSKLWIKAEGERARNATQDASAEMLWDKNIARWWSVQSGVRHDFGEGPSRTWAAVGVQGLAPYWFDVEATLYLGDAGRAAIRLKTDYEILITQRWVLQPEAELNAYTKEDAERRLGSGLSDLALGLRLRYEIRREIAPYVGLAWSKRFGSTADLVRASSEDSSDLSFIAGLRFRF